MGTCGTRPSRCELIGLKRRAHFGIKVRGQSLAFGMDDLDGRCLPVQIRERIERAEQSGYDEAKRFPEWKGLHESAGS